MNADSGAPCSQRHSKKKQFIDSLKKHLGSHSTIKHLTGESLTERLLIVIIWRHLNGML